MPRSGNKITMLVAVTSRHIRASPNMRTYRKTRDEFDSSSEAEDSQARGEFRHSLHKGTQLISKETCAGS